MNTKLIRLSTMIRLVTLLAAAATFATHSVRVSAQNAQPGAEAWGNDNCLYVATGAGWQKSPLCRVFRGNANVWDQYLENDPQQRMLRINVSQPGWVVVTDPTNGSTFALPFRGSFIHLLDGGLASAYVPTADGRWVPAAQIPGVPAAPQQPAGAYSTPSSPAPGYHIVGGQTVDHPNDSPEAARLRAMTSGSESRQTATRLEPSCMNSSFGCRH